MKRLALVASFCGITITQMMAQNINGEQISDTTLFEKFSKELGEVVVKAHLPQYKKTHEGLLTNVAGTVLSKMGTAEDVLKHVPSIVKKKDGYEVVGKGTPIIYINGRKMQDISELDNIKSSDIKSVEVIQNPGATYDASVNAVISLVGISDYLVIILHFLFGINLGKHSLSYGLGHLGAVGIVIIRCILLSIRQVGNNLLITFLRSLARRIIDRIYLIDILGCDGLCDGRNDRERTPQTSHSEHHQGTEDFALCLIGMIFSF